MEHPNVGDQVPGLNEGGSEPAAAPSPPLLPPHWRPPAAGGSSSTGGTQPVAVTGPPTWSSDLVAGQPGGSGIPPWGPGTDTNGAAPVPPTGAPASPRSEAWRWFAVAMVAAVVGAGVGAGVVAAFANNNTDGATVKQISAGPALLNGTTNIQAVIAKVLPAVVTIDAKATVPSSGSIFGQGQGSNVSEDQGTGMIITADGEVVTNNHVISGATTITVTLYGKTTSMPATLVDADPSSDIALLRITGASDLPTVSYGNSDNVQVGDAVVAVGNALGLSAGTPTVTQGIISAKGRTVKAGDSGSSATETLTNMLQTDAAISSGNSGGPLVDSSGKVIGMNAAVAATTTGTSQAENIGFAIPSNKITGLLPSLRNRSIGSQTPQGTGYLGVSLETLTPQLRSAYNFVPTQGAVVLDVQSGSPADVAGLQQGDVITSFDGKAVTSADQLATTIQGDHPGQSVKIGLYRGQAQMTVTATLSSGASSTQR